MDTRSQIIQLGDKFIRERGYNAFSFSDISGHLNIKNASVHYHFPNKTALGIAIVQEHLSRVNHLIDRTASKSPLDKLKAFLSIYTVAKSENKVCIVGSLATDLNTVEPEIQAELKKLVSVILNWVIEFLQEGRRSGVFHFTINTRVKALLIITNMLAALQLTRLTSKQDFQHIKDNVINDLIQPSA